MKPKTIVTAVLLAFVAVSVAFLVVKERRGAAPETAAPAEGAPAVSGENAGDAATARAVTTGTVVYYFHGTRRCPTCRKLEEYTREAIMAAFAGDIEAGTLGWRPVDTDVPGNEHFVKDYVLSTKSVVLSAVTDGEETRWRNLPRIWELVGDKNAYIAYIQSEVRTFQEGR
jgi:hypothetical protein